MVLARSKKTLLCCLYVFCSTGFIITVVKSQALPNNEMEYILHSIVNMEERHHSVYDSHPDPNVVDLVIGVGFHLNTATAREHFQSALPAVNFDDVYEGRENLTGAEIDQLFRVATLPDLIERATSTIAAFHSYPIDVKAALVHAIFSGILSEAVIELINDPDETWTEVCVRLVSDNDTPIYLDEFGSKDVKARRQKTCTALFDYGQSLMESTALYNPCLDKYAHFYPYGPEFGDNVNLLADDGSSGQVNISTDFTYFGEQFDSLWINTNGIVSFSMEFSDVVPGVESDHLPTAMVAPFWADVDTWQGGEVFWRETTDENTLRMATNDVRMYFVDRARFTATWMLIATWDDVGYYGSFNPDLGNTFQAVLITDGRDSFVLFNYVDIEWTSGRTTGGDPFTGLGGTTAVVGFNVWPGGDNSFYLANTTYVDLVVDIDNSSNVEVAGRYAFRVDKHRVKDPACTISGAATIYPFVGTMLGGQEVRVAGPCYSAESDVKCRFSNQDVEGTLVNPLTAKCITPVFYTVGRIPLLVSIDGGKTFPHQTTYTVLSVEETAPDVIRENALSWFDEDEVEISWDSTQLPSRFVDIHLLGYTESPDVGTFGWQQSAALAIQYDQVVSDGRFRFRTRQGGVPYDVGAIRISIHDSLGRGIFVFQGLWSDVHDISWNFLIDPQEWCRQWSEENTHPARGDLTCPCTLKQAYADPGGFPPLSACRQGDEQSCLFRSKDVHCVRSQKAGVNGTGLECCYSSQGGLLDSRDTLDAGPRYLRHQRGEPPYNVPGNIPFLSHYVADLLPRQRCCHRSNSSFDCLLYFKDRPSDDCKTYETLQPAAIYGDTHVVTFDGLSYSIAGYGEFTVLDADFGEFVMQARISPSDYLGLVNTFDAIAMKGELTATVHVEQGIEGTVVYVRPVGSTDWESVDFTEGLIWHFEGVSVRKNNVTAPNVLVSFDTGQSMNVLLYGSKIAVILLGPQMYKYGTWGLFGTWNENPQDDFMVTTGGIPLSTESPNDIIYQDFVMKWAVSRNSSLFYDSYVDGGRQIEKSNKTTQVIEACLSNGRCISENTFIDDTVEASAALADAITAYEKTWNDTRPVATCPYLPTPANARKISGINYTPGSDVVFECFIGYSRTGPSERKCLADGSWDGFQMTCEIVSCVQLPAPANGFRLGDNFTYSSIVAFGCNSGYELTGNADLICLANGSWDSTPPYCQIKPCPPVSAPSNGTRIGDEFLYGSTLEFLCNEGFTLSGSRLLECLADGMWDRAIPTCEINVCPIIDVPMNGLIQNPAPVYEYQYEVHFECNEGYILNGSTEMTCLANGSWDSVAPSCQILSCPSLHKPAHGGIVEPYREEYASVVEFTCRDGYYVEGARAITCLSNATWDSDEPICRIVNCGNLSKPDNGGMSSNGTVYQSMTSFYCDFGYDLVGSADRTCTANGTWDGQYVICQIKVCPVLQAPMNGSLTASSFEFNSVVVYQCDEGFTLDGSSTSRCLGNGQWDTDPPMCDINVCPKVDVPMHGLIENQVPVYEYQYEIHFECIEGYTLKGRERISCLANSTWDSVAPTCEIKLCPVLQAPMNGSLTASSFEFNFVVVYHCDEGFTLEGSSASRCLGNGQWDTDPPICDINRCPPVDAPVNGTFWSTGHTYGSQGYFQCHEDYKLNGTSTTFCLAHGVWSAQTPSCELVTCEPLRPPLNGMLVGSGDGHHPLPVHTSVTVNCHTGYQLIDSDSSPISCSSNGTWDKEVPNCEVVECSALQAPTNGTIYGDSWTYSSVVTFSCNNGLILIGVNVTECLANGKWKDDAPLCKHKEDERFPSPKPGLSENQKILIIIICTIVFLSVVVFGLVLALCHGYHKVYSTALVV
ncbi:uncharacterized protein [Ptychodera flava]|uniref:uncharacterized protein n=1 Tax=Ptychodera flava TaxID=63121 RepID=UPI003969FDA3